MARNRLLITGLKEDFQGLPGALGSMVEPLLREGASTAADDVRAAYPAGRSGKLRDGVVMVPKITGDPLIAGYIVKSTAEYARAYEFGAHGGKPGPQKARPTFIPITNRQRRATRDVLIAHMKALGFTITGGG